MNSSSPISGKAILSVVLAILILPGLPALIVGYLGLREINESDGRIKGRLLAIFGMIMGGVGTLLCILGLIVMVVMNIREQANRTVCRNNLRELGLALNRYCEVKGAYPPGTVGVEGLPPERRLSWMVEVLPYLEVAPPRQPPVQTQWETLYRKFDRLQGWDALRNQDATHTSIRLFRCPSHPERPSTNSPSRTDYVGVAGVGHDSALLPIEDPNAGFFGYDRGTRREDVKAGISNTMMTAETAWENGPWASGGRATVRGLDVENHPYLGFGRPWGGLHSGGCNILFVDGSVGFVADSIDPRVFEKLVRINAAKEEPPE